MNVVAMLEAQAAIRPDAPAIVDGSGSRARVTSYRELDARTRHGAQLLESLGLKAGDRVLILHPMSAALYVALISSLRLGLVAVFVESSAGLPALDRCCSRVHPRAFVGSGRAHLLRAVLPSVRKVPCRVALGALIPGARFWNPETESDASLLADLPNDAPALLTLTSGTGGPPKAAVRTHAFLRAQYESLQRVMQLTAGEVDLTTLPIVMLANLASGVTSVIPDVNLRRPGSIDADRVLAQIDEHDVTRTAASPAFLERLAERCIESGRVLHGLDRVVAGGGPVFPPLLARLKRVMPNAAISAVYGSSEAEPIAELAYADVGHDDRQAMAHGRGLLAGRTVSSIDLRVLPNRTGRSIGPFTAVEFDEDCLPAELAGEIVVAGDHVLRGYLDGDGDDLTKFRVDGRVWHRTGDAGMLDAQGRLWLLGRAAALVKDARGVLYPFAVECAAMHHPNVRHAALVEQDGRRYLAVELRDRHDAASLSALRESLAWAAIENIYAYPKIPLDRRHNAKVDYAALRELIRRRPAESIG